MKRTGHNFFSYLAIGLVALSIGTYFRLYPLLFLNSSDASEKATVLVLSRLRSEVTRQVQTQSPGLTEAEQNRLIQQQLDAVLREEGKNAINTINRLSEQIEKETPPQQQKKYLLASDSYYYYGLTKNILATGKIATTIRGSKYFNPYMLAPEGHWEPFTLHPFVGFAVYKTSLIFNPQISLMTAVSFTPIALTFLSGIIFIFICYLLRLALIPTLTGTVFFLLIPVHLKRSMFGWYDNDPHNVLFPLAVIACLIWGFDKIADRKKRTIAALFCAALLMLYACFWQGWVYLFSIIIFAGALIFLYCRFVVNDRPTAKNTAQYFGILAAGTLIALGLFFGPREFFVLFQEGTKAIGEFLSPQLSLWPNMYISVGELRSASVADILELSGGLFVFVVALMGLGYSCRRAIAHRNTAREPWLVILLGVFFVISFMITLGAQRFAILFLTPLCLCFLLGLQEIFTFVKQKTDKTFVSRKFYIKTVYVALSILMLGITLVPIGSAREKTRSLLDPIFNPVWENVLEKIRTQTPPESIINTWWPPGHFISAIAERRVTFDGATINVPQAYWMAKVFLSNSEEQAMGILRMLNNSGNTAALYLQSLGIDLSVGVERILQVLPMSRPDAATALADILTLEQTGHLLALTHPKETTPSYLLIYRELMDKNLELGFVGRWNFTKMEYLRANPESALDIPKRKSKEYVNFLWDTIGGPLRYSEILTQLGVDENKILLEENLTVDLTTMSARINSSTYGKGTPQSIFYSNGESVIEHPLAGANLNFSLVLIRQKNAYIGILMDKALARSLLVRLFWFEGKGLKYFKPFCKDTDLTQRTQIYVYEEDWNKFLSDSSP